MPLSLRRIAVLVAVATLGACESTTGPSSSGGAVHQGFDTSVYPGDATMRAWLAPASPYEWTGFYLPAPCHHDVSWSGKRATLEGMGWGIAAIYVGQQEWEGVPNLIPWPTGVMRTAIAERSAIRAATQPSCTRTLLTTAEGQSEGNAAAAQMAAEGFAPGSTVYLDVEYMTTVDQTMKDYVASWIAAVLLDGRYEPGIYVAKRNADEIRAVALGAYSGTGRSGEPRWWITSSTSFSRTSDPTDVGLAYADAWQGLYDQAETYGGATVTVDVNVSTMASPSAP